MVFPTKLPEPNRNRMWSVLALAKALECERGQVRAALESENEFVVSDRKYTIVEPVAQRVATLLGLRLPDVESHAPSPWKWRDQGGPEPKKRREDEKVGPKPHSTATKVDCLSSLGGLNEDTTPAFADAYWKLLGLSELERDAWMAAGLRRGQAKTADELRQAGFHPSDLAIIVDGWPVMKHLKGGELPRDVFSRLKRLRNQEQDSA